MFASQEMLNLVAKQLAMLASEQVHRLAEAVTGRDDYSDDVTGTVLSFMPHIIEKAIITSPSIPADVGVLLCAKFLNDFEAIVKITANAVGFSNPIKKAWFNIGFSKMFRGEYDVMKPKFNKLWEAARFDQADPLDFIALVVLKRAEAASGNPLDNNRNRESAGQAVSELFAKVHSIIEGS